MLGFYAGQLPGVRYHAFGLHVRALDDDRTFWAVRSWDSYSWTWARGAKRIDRPKELLKQPDETYTAYTGRAARFYYTAVVGPRLARPRQMSLFHRPEEAPSSPAAPAPLA